MLIGLLCLMLGLALLYAPPSAVRTRFSPREAAVGIVWREGRALIDINSADQLLLMELEGLGEALAGRIVSERELNGPYRNLEALNRVRGIGEAKIAALTPRVTVGP